MLTPVENCSFQARLWLNLQGFFAAAIAPKPFVFLQSPQGRSELVQLLPLTVFGLGPGTECTAGCADTRICLPGILRQDFSELLYFYLKDSFVFQLNYRPMQVFKSS